MKEKPILFSAPMVNAILAGRKTQTRRAVPEKLLEKYSDYDEWCNAVMSSDVPSERAYEQKFYSERSQYWPEDRLWVRETFAQRGEMKSAIYKADEAKAIGAYGCVKWKPSIFMPRWASRITLEIVGVRVERLCDISNKDADAEGILQCDGILDESEICRHAKAMGIPPDESRPWFASLWESINGVDSWEANPWVWVIEFKRINQ